MNVRQAILGEISIRSGQVISSVDIGVLVRRLILFDNVIVRSFRLREIPSLVRTFGKSGFSALLQSGLLHFNCNFNSVIIDLSLNGVRHLPLDHFSLATVKAANPESDLRSELRCLQSVTGLKNQQRATLEEDIWKSLVWEPPTYSQALLDQIESDLRGNTPALKAALLDKLRKECGASDLAPSGVQINVEETKERVFRIRNTKTDSLGLNQEKSHSLMQGAVTAVANLNQRLADMQAHSAITGFLDEEAPLLFGKLSGIVAPYNPNIAEGQFNRVIELADVPDFKPGQKVDVESLLKVRDSRECREFREWLSTVDKATDKEIKDMVAGLRSKAAILANTPGGKLLRLAATTGIGLVPGVGLVVGVAAGIVDSFLVDKVLPQSGVVAFLAEKYPSLFVSP
jgi:hypothetical protein